jgi:hypothetical protein
MDEEDGRPGPPPGHIIGDGSYFAKYGTRQQEGFQDPGRLKLLIDVTEGRARQSGRVDALTDASTMSLCSSSANSCSYAETRMAFLVPGSAANRMHSHLYPPQGELL